MHQIPEQVTKELGRIVYFAGHADYYLGLFAPRAGGEQTSQGYSGQRLLKALKATGESEPRLQELLDVYGPMYDRRNALVHGAHNWIDGQLWTWYIPLGKKGEAEQLVSWSNSLWGVRAMADSWERLTDAAHDLFHEVFPDADCRG